MLFQNERVQVSLWTASKLIIQYFQNKTLIKRQNIIMTFSYIFPIILNQNYLLYATKFLN